MATKDVLEHLSITHDEWVKYGVCQNEEELATFTPEERARAALVRRVAVFGVGHELYPATGRPVEQSMSFASNAIHLHWLRKEKLEQNDALKSLLASVKEMPA